MRRAPAVALVAVLERLTDLMASRRHALIGLAVTRIGFGSAILLDLAIHLPLRHQLWGSGSWVDADHLVTTVTVPFNVLLLGGGTTWFLDLAYAAYAMTAFAFTLGWRTRVITPVLWVLMWSFQERNIYLTNGGDNLARILLLYLMFAQLDAHLSIHRTAPSPADSTGRVRRTVTSLGTIAHNAAALACVLQLATVYTASAMFKIQGEKWQEGTAVYYITRVAAYDSWPEIARVFALSPLVLTAVTYITVFAQLFFVSSLLRPVTRHLMLTVLVGMHAGIGFLMGLPVFSLFMISADLMIITDSEWRAFGRRLRLDRWRRSSLPDQLGEPSGVLPAGVPAGDVIGVTR